MIKVGLVDFDTSHVVQFTRRMNHLDIEEAQWVYGAQVVAGCPGESRHSPERIPEYTQQLKNYGIKIVDRPEDLLGKIDAVCLEANEGGVHLDRARMFIEAGLPCFIDKPFEVDIQRAREIVRLAEKKKVPILSASSLRFAPEVRQAAQDASIGKLLGANAYSPASEHPVNPGLFNYGIHGVETLYAFMKEGCQKVSCAYTSGAEVVTGIWKEDRIGVYRGIRHGASGYGFTLWGEKAIKQGLVGLDFIYHELVKEIVQMFETGVAPIDPRVTLEIVAFILAAIKSRQNAGTWVNIQV